MCLKKNAEKPQKFDSKSKRLGDLVSNQENQANTQNSKFFECYHCEKTFDSSNEEAYKTHSKACEEFFAKKRKDSAKQRKSLGKPSKEFMGSPQGQWQFIQIEK